MKVYTRRIESSLPKSDLETENVENAKLLPNREELLMQLPKNSIVAEIGVDEGDFSELILKVVKPQKLHLIDFWGSKRYNQEKREKVQKKFASLIDTNTVEIDLGLSTQVVKEFDNHYFDWIYIDTNHSYETTFKELELYSLKVKDNGIIAGHDYIQGNWSGLVRYGVIEAVHEFCLKYGWEIIYLTTELSDYPSFAIRRIRKD